MNWISVEDRLPEGDISVSAAFYETAFREWVFGIARFETENNKWHSCFLGYIDDCFDPQFWMPLPNPPEL